MKSVYDPVRKAHLTSDDENRVRHIRHSTELWPTEHKDPRVAAAAYLRQMADVLGISLDQLSALQQPVSYRRPLEQGIQFHLGEVKSLFDSTTVSYCQTHLNVPLWRKGISVTIKHHPNRIVDAINTGAASANTVLPNSALIDLYLSIFSLADQRWKLPAERQDQEGEPHTLVRRVLAAFIEQGGSKQSRKESDASIQLLNGRFFVYRYVGDRQPRSGGKSSSRREDHAHNVIGEDQEGHPFIELPAVPGQIQVGQDYLVAELRFVQRSARFGHITWLVLVEIETGSILLLESLTCGVDGLVLTYDPITRTGDLTITSNQSNSVLNPLRDRVTLQQLDAPVGGDQHLRGVYVYITNQSPPDVAPPIKPAADDFDFDVRTNDFAAVSAYYHLTDLFLTLESLGFDKATYFDGTTFPIPVDARGMDTAAMDLPTTNAHWDSNGAGGTGHLCYALMDVTAPTADTIGRAVDKWVHWHEMAGHGSLGDHVNSGNFAFAHSAGDGLAALQNDPVSRLRSMPERFQYSPFRPTIFPRKFGGPDRQVVDGWAWGGEHDDTDIRGEQILAASHFQVYRSIGGDSEHEAMRWVASRVTTYLILRAIGQLTEAANADNSMIWCEKLMAVDKENWTTEGLSGGAYNKVIRWAFEQRGLYQPAGASGFVTKAGDPPNVDVYIDDGRQGEYTFQPVHWMNESLWNRNNADGLVGHQNPIEGVTNYMFVKVKNRGTAAAADVVVKGYYSLPGAGFIWPTDFNQMQPLAGFSIGSLAANSAAEVIVGPFQWIPTAGVDGHAGMMAIATSDEDPSNVSNLAAGETIADWRLVPNDNNVAQRNVHIVPVGGGEEA